MPFPSNSLQSKRWLPCHNVGDITIPPHAILRLVDLDEESEGQRNRFFNQEFRDQLVVWRVARPNAESLATMDPAMFVANGPQSILPDGYGECSQDWPLPVLHDGESDDLVNGAPCGPAEDLFWIMSSGFAFTCISHDIAARVGKGDIHTAWIAPSNHLARKCGVGFGGATVSSGATVALSSTQKLLGMTRNAAGNALVTDLAGLYQVSFACTLTSPSALRGSTLTLKLYLDTTDTGYAVSRTQDIELDAYGEEVLTTTENVAAPQCLIDADEEQAFSVVNTSAYSVTITNFWLSALRLGPRTDAYDEEGDGLSYP